MTEIIGAVHSLKAAKDILKALYSLSVKAEVQAKLTEIGDHLMAAQVAAFDAQVEQQAMANRIRDLEAKLVEFENWEAEKQRYELKELVPGVLVYAQKPSVENTEPEHYLCANCYQERTKSILQNASRAGHRIVDILRCHRCGFQTYTG